MGGAGSGSYFGYRARKKTVEESVTLSMTDFRKRLDPGTEGTVTFAFASGRRASLHYWVTKDLEELTVTLCYRRSDGEDVRLPIRLVATPARFGGKRSFFLCPLVVGGANCNRRAAKLYLPPGARFFACRACYNLTYRSSQEAHREERLLARLGFDGEFRHFT
jgi:hypothetical protein